MKKEHDREQLTLAINLLAGAAANLPLQPINQCLVFKEGVVYANRDSVSCIMELDSGQECAVSASALTGILNGSTAKKITLDTVDDTLIVKEGRFKASLVTIPLTAETFEMPPLPAKGDWVRIGTSFAEAIAMVRDFADVDGRFPNRKGIRIEFGKDVASFCTWKGQFAVRYSAEVYAEDAEPPAEFAIINPQAIDIVVSAFKAYAPHPPMLAVTDDHVVFKFKPNTEKGLPKCLLYCQQPEPDQDNKNEMLEYAELFKDMYKNNGIVALSYWEKPKAMDAAIARCTTIINNNDASPQAYLRIRDDAEKETKKIVVAAEGSLGKVVAGFPGVPADVRLMRSAISPQELVKISRLAETIAIGSKDIVAFKNKNFEAVMFCSDPQEA